MPSQEIEAIRARHEAATKGPYEWLNANPYGKGTEFDCLQGPNGELMIQPFHDGAMMRTGGFCDRAADAEALAASWADRATLLDEVDRLKNAVAYAEDALHGSYCVCDTSVKCAPCEVRDTLGEVLDGKSVPE